MEDKPLVDKEYVLEKFPGKGGWTYAVIREIAPDKKSKFGWVQVSGFVDSYELKQYKLMPTGNGNLFLPIRKEIRKSIDKEAGDKIHIVLYLDQREKEIPEEFLECLEEEPEAKAFFNILSDSEKSYYLDWIYSAKKDETKVERIINTLSNLAKHKKFMQRDK